MSDTTSINIQKKMLDKSSFSNKASELNIIGSVGQSDNTSNPKLFIKMCVDVLKLHKPW